MDHTQLQAVWAQILNHLREQLKESAFKWLDPLKPISLNDTELVLGTDTGLAKDWITGHYLAIIADAVTEVVGSKRHVVLTVVESEKNPTEEAPILPPPAITPPEPSKKIRRKNDNPNQGQLFIDDTAPSASSESNTFLNPKYTFDTFVMGSSNRFAHAAAMAVAEKPGQVYNPFFMYGGVGLGKTHLMQAIGHRVLQNNPNMRVLYVSSEQFTNEIIRSIQEGTSEKFRQKYRNIDVLLVDDIQFISGKTSTQEEFFHTFNTLYDAQKQIILSSDRPPKEVERLEDRLRSRFEWGLTADIQSPDLETRIAILKNKAQLDHYTVPNDVMVYIATHIDSNIRELEGSLTKVVAYADFIKKPVTTELAAEALKDMIPNSKKKEVNMEVIQEIIASYFKIKIEDLHSKKRSRPIAYPRQIAMYLCRELTETSLPQIGKFFGGRDHTTVLHAYEKILKERETDTKLSKILSELMERIQKI